MQKNVAGQKWRVFAYDRTTQIPKTGDAANITAVISIDGAASGATNDLNPTELSGGFYEFSLTQAETNGSELLIIASSVTSSIQVIGAPATVTTTPVAWPTDVVQTGDAFARIGAAGASLTSLGDTRLANLDALISSRLAPTVSGRTLDVTPTGEAGIDWANVSNPSTTLNLSGTTIASVSSLAIAEIADGVWDEIISGAEHNIPGSAGRRLRTLAGTVVYEGTAQGPGTGSNQIQLDVGASAVDGAYDPSNIVIIAGTGSGQSRLILQYNGTTKTATVDRNWRVNPSTDSEFYIYSHPGREHVNEGLAQAGGASSITLNANASSVDDVYVGQSVFIRSGTGDDQVGLVTAYNGTTKVATIETAIGGWATIPDTTSAYVMMPMKHYLISEIQNGLATQGDVAAIPAATITALGAGTEIFGHSILESIRRVEVKSGSRLSGAGSGSEVQTSVDASYSVTWTVDPAGNITAEVWA